MSSLSIMNYVRSTDSKLLVFSLNEHAYKYLLAQQTIQLPH